MFQPLRRAGVSCFPGRLELTHAGEPVGGKRESERNPPAPSFYSQDNKSICFIGSTSFLQHRHEAQTPEKRKRKRLLQYDFFSSNRPIAALYWRPSSVNLAAAASHCLPSAPADPRPSTVVIEKEIETFFFFQMSQTKQHIYIFFFLFKTGRPMTAP